MTEKDRIAEIRERRAKITAPPWTWEPVGEFDGQPSNAGGFTYQHIRSGHRGVADTYHASGMQCPDGGVIEPRHGRKEDADFIAHAPADIDYLLAALSTARDKVWKAAMVIAKHPNLKNGMWSKEQDIAAESVQERIAFALECASRGEDYRGSLESAKAKAGDK